MKLFRTFGVMAGAGGAKKLELPGTPLAIYSVVKKPGYSGYCCRVKRASDSATLDVGFTSNGIMDAAAIFTFMGASTVTVITWYDQSGNGYDGTATTKAPTIINGNAISGVQPISFAPSAGFGDIKIDLPAGLAVSTQDFTACMAFAGGGGWLSFNSLFSVGTQVNLWWEKNTGVLQGSSLFTGGNKNQFSPRQAQIDSVILSGSASQRILRNNGNSQTVASAYTLATTAGGSIGTSSIIGTGSNEMFAYVVYGSALTVGDKQLVESAFSSAFRANSPFTIKMLFDGDSITAGFTIGAYMYGWPRVVSDILGTSYGLYNISVPGQGMSGCYSGRAQATARYDSSYSKNINCVFAGTNDIDNRATGTIVGYGTTVFNTYTLPYILAMQAAGFDKVFMGTVIARNWAGSAQDKLDKEAERLVYNQLVRDNAAANGYVVLDFASLPEMSNYANTTYIVDAVHPTRTGYAVMGAYAAPIILAALTSGNNLLLEDGSFFLLEDGTSKILLEA